MAAVNTNRN